MLIPFYESFFVVASFVLPLGLSFGSSSCDHRWGELVVSIGGAMRKAGTGDAKLRQALEVKCSGDTYRYTCQMIGSLPLPMLSQCQLGA